VPETRTEAQPAPASKDVAALNVHLGLSGPSLPAINDRQLLPFSSRKRTGGFRPNFGRRS